MLKDLVQRQGVFSGCMLVLAVVYTLYFAQALSLPIFLAIMLALVLSPFVRMLKRIRLPEFAGAGLVVVTILVIFGWLVLAISGPASEWSDRWPLIKLQLEQKLETLRGPIEQVQEVTKNLQEAANMGEEEGPADTVVVEGPSLLQRIFVEAQSTFVGIVVVVVLVFFLLSQGDRTCRRVAAAIADEDERELWTGLFTDIQSNLAHYLLTVALINTTLGVLTAAAMMVLGMPNALLWGVLAGVMNFIPYAGALVTLMVITLVSVLSFDQLVPILLPPLAFGMLTFLEGQIISPIVVGRRLTLDPIAVFLSILFWGWLWGFAGMLLAVPILATLKISIGAFKSLAPLAALIDSEGDEELAVEAAREAEEARTNAAEAQVEAKKQELAEAKQAVAERKAASA
jgi:predicted PurR-regulated permease PerM